MLRLYGVGTGAACALRGNPICFDLASNGRILRSVCALGADLVRQAIRPRVRRSWPVMVPRRIGMAAAMTVALSVPALAQTTGSERVADKAPHVDIVQSLADTLRSWSDAGVTLNAQFIGEPAANVSGGVKHGSTFSGQLQFGADLDLYKLLRMRGGKFHILAFQNAGSSLSRVAVGPNYSVQETYKHPYEQIRLGAFNYEQTLFHNRLNFVVGRMGTSSYFARIKEFCDFVSSISCVSPALPRQQSGLTLLNQSTWGLVVRTMLTQKLRIFTGINEVNPRAKTTWGTNWSTRYATGIAVPFELYYSNVDTDPKYPYKIKIGQVFSNGTHTDPYLNGAGLSRLAHGGAAMRVRTREMVYIDGKVTVWHGKKKKNTPAITVFGAFFHQFDPSEIYTDEALAGIVYHNPFPAFPASRLGFEIGYLHIGPHQRAYLEAMREKMGGSGNTHSHEFDMELNYNFQIMPGLRFGPSIQYIIHPDNSSIPKISFVPRNAVVVGGQFIINAAQLLGTPTGQLTDRQPLRTLMPR